MKGLTKWVYKLGLYILQLLKLQLLWIWYSLKGGIILGVFPATAAIYDTYFYWFQNIKEVDEFVDKERFDKAYYENRKASNVLGYVMLLILLFFYVDLRISEKYIKNLWLHLFLTVVAFIFVAIGMFIFPSIVRYDLSIKDHFKQAFFLVPFSILNLVAMMIGMGLALNIMTAWPILAICIGVPLYILPAAWFAWQSLQKLEENQSKRDLEDEMVEKRKDVAEEKQKGSVKKDINKEHDIQILDSDNITDGNQEQIGGIVNE